MSAQFSEHDQRVYLRHAAVGYFRVRTTSAQISFKGELRDVSRSGAFIRTTLFPEQGEEITFEILDLHDRLQMLCSGTVARVDKTGRVRDYGFAVHFDHPLPADVEQLLMQ